MRRPSIIVTSIMAMVIGNSFVSAGGLFRDGVGARSVGRGGTNLGFADTGEILLDNPSAITNIPGSYLLSVGADLLMTDLEYSDQDNPTPVDGVDNPFPMGQVALMRKSADGRWGWGVGMFSQGGLSSEYTLNGPAPLVGPRHYKSLGALARILPALSYKVHDYVSVGGTLGLAVSHAELEGPYFLQGPHAFAGTPTMLDVQGTGTGLSWSVGAQLQLTGTTTFGVSYTGETQTDLEGSTLVTIPGLGMARYDSTLEVRWPSVLAVGAAQQLPGGRRLGLDVLWLDWANSFDRFDLQLRDPDNPVFTAVTGPRLLEQYPLKWKGSVSARVGYEQDLGNEKTMRMGYAYHSNPLPDSTLTAFIQTTTQHTVSFGYGFKIHGYDCDLAYQFMTGKDRTVAESEFLGGDSTNARVTTDAHWILFSLRKVGL